MKKKLKLINELREILMDEKFREFTVLALRAEFETRFGLLNFRNSSELRKYIYRRILLLVRNENLIKIIPKAGGACIYQVSKQLSEALRESSSITQHRNMQLIDNQDSSQVNALKTKLNQYQVDMLAYAGECKEYQQIVAQYPNLRDKIEPMYCSARERSSELMGQLRAINNILNRSSSSQ